MVKISQLLRALIKKTLYAGIKDSHIYYRIIEKEKGKERLLMQCINTNGLFYASLDDIIYDIDILYGLSPSQACYVGIEYSKMVRNNKSLNNQKKPISIHDYFSCRYGDLAIIAEDRTKNIIFLNKVTGEEFQMDARDLALSNLIEKFDAMQAFYIGVLAGNKISRPSALRPLQKEMPSYLRLVK